MRKLIIAAAATFALAGVAACNSPADNAAEEKADALEEQAAAAPTEAQETALNEQADMVEQQAGNADGGMKSTWPSCTGSAASHASSACGRKNRPSRTRDGAQPRSAATALTLRA